MAFPQVVATNNSANADGGTFHIISLPSGIVAGSLVLVFVATDGDISWSSLDGFTQLKVINNGTVSSVSVMYKYCGGGETTVTFYSYESEQSAHISCRITGDAGSGTIPQVSTGTTGATTTPDPDLLTPTGGAKDYLWLAACGCDDDDGLSGYPLPDNNTYKKSNTGSGTCQLGICSDELNQAELNPGTFTTATAEQWAACTVAVHPPAGAQTYYQNSGQGATAPTGILNKQGYKDTGNYVTVLVGSLGTIPTFLVSVGTHTMVIAGTLGTVITFVHSVGSYAMTLAGGLTRQTHKAVGGYSVTVAGDLAKQSFKCIGEYVMTISGTLSTATIFLQTAGQAALTISGSLIKKMFLLVGSGAVGSVGSLVKKTSIFIGKAATSILGTLSTTTIFLQGIGSGNISPTGTLGAIVIIVSSVGGAAMTILGSLAKAYTAGSGAVKRGIALLLRFM